MSKNHLDVDVNFDDKFNADADSKNDVDADSKNNVDADMPLPMLTTRP